MFDVYAFATPNSIKVPIALEELGLDYTLHTVNVRQGEQKTADFLALNPNAKVPVLGDPDAEGGRLVLTESAAILVYLAEKTGRLLPPFGKDRARVFEQLFFHASGLGPAFGQAGFFQRQAAENSHSPSSGSRPRPSGRWPCSTACWPLALSSLAPNSQSPTSPSSVGCGAANSPASTWKRRRTWAAGTLQLSIALRSGAPSSG